ncbi:MAG: hypothetical protein L7H10_00675 [Vulcanisaeta sp.]|nr:hypothetical protein [Vulcanisaeta sp.]MCG2869240.1 hypothetical protein [Vulcanisaeta sp.]MCG2880991.1 hypothetical protein [Vulcanisaeta sp.]MCG2886588.1 hypothetical protein [Vulcanisaeta sp.]
MSTRMAGLVADLLLRTCNATSVERQSFINGARYMVRFGENSNMEVHLIDKDGVLFAEFWVSTYATPIIIVEYLYSNTEPASVCREICALVEIINNSLKRKPNPQGNK